MNTATAPVRAEQPSEPSGVKRVLLLVFGSIVVLIALAFLAGGGVGLWALGERDSSGYFTTGTHELSSGSYAIASESLDVDGDVPNWFADRFATARLQASSAQPVFIGIARASEVERYLAGAQYDQITDIDADPFSVTYRRMEGSDQITDIDADPFSVTYRRMEGSAQPATPTEQDFWRVEASGSGTQTITWPLEEGEWSAVAMNADGSRDVTVDAQFGARVSSLVWVVIAFLIIGVLILIGGAALIYFGARRRRPAPQTETPGV